MRTINIGFCGAGTVGGGALEILAEKREFFLAQGLDFQVKIICARNLKQLQTYADQGVILTENYRDIVENKTIDVVVEVVGGITIAWDIVKEALQNGKHVVTANKALIAEYFETLYELLSDNAQLKFGFEAAVGGGIPIISTLQTQFQSDEVTQLAGILNGTTNFILSKMELEGASYNDVLKEAQALGFAEADPTADVEGYDARAKISILTQLVTGVKVSEDEIFTQGISRLGAIDFEYAYFLGSTIKLLAVSQMRKGHISSFVMPSVVHKNNAIARINGATNILEIESKYQEKTYLIGQGAGKFPTGNSIVADLLRIAQSSQLSHFAPLKKAVIDSNFSSAFYIRFWVKDQLGIIEKVGQHCAENNISIDSVVQLPIEDSANLPFIITTKSTKLKNIEAFCSQIQSTDFCNEAPLFMPILK